MSDELEGIRSLKGINKFSNKYVTKRVIDFLLEEGFEERDNNSYSYVDRDECDKNCYFQHVGENKYNYHYIYVYITDTGIGIDYDWSCGGNVSTYIIEYIYAGSFVNAYNDMLEHVKELRLQK